MSRSNDDLFRGWKKTPAPPDLKERVVSAVRKGRMARQRRLTDRLWESRTLRYGWAAAAAALLAFNIWLPEPAEHGQYRAAAVEERAEFDPVLASLVQDRLPPRHTWADQGTLASTLLGEVHTVATDGTSHGGNP